MKYILSVALISLLMACTDQQPHPVTQLSVASEPEITVPTAKDSVQLVRYCTQDIIRYEQPVYDKETNTWYDTCGLVLGKGEVVAEGNSFCGEYREYDYVTKSWKSSTRFLAKDVSDKPVTPEDIRKFKVLLSKRFPKYPEITIKKTFKIEVGTGTNITDDGEADYPIYANVFIVTVPIKEIAGKNRVRCTFCDGVGYGGPLAIGLDHQCMECGGTGYIENIYVQDGIREDMWVVNGNFDVDYYINLDNGIGMYTAHDDNKLDSIRFFREDYSPALAQIQKTLDKIK